MASTVTFRIDEKKVEKLDSLAVSMDRNRSFVINEALDSYLEYQQWRLEQIEEGIADVEAGRTISYEDHKKKMKSFVANLKTRSQKSTASSPRKSKHVK